MDYTTAKLIDDIKRRILVPDSNGLFTDAQMVAFANDELHNYIVPKLKGINEEYYVTYTDTAVSTTTKRYSIPTSAVGMTLRDVVFVNTDDVLTNIPRLSYEKISSWNGVDNLGFYIEDDEIVLTDYPSDTSLSLRMYYERRPNVLVETSACGQIVSINPSTNELQLSNVPFGWVAGTSLCAISNTPMFHAKQEATAILTISTPTIGITDVTGLVVGDWIALEGETPIPQIPVEGMSFLAQASLTKMLFAMGDGSVKVAKEDLNELEENFISLLTPRVTGQVQKLTNHNSLLKARSNRSHRNDRI